MKILLLTILSLTLTSCVTKTRDVKFRFNENDIDEINTFDNTWTRKYIGSEEKVHFQLTTEERMAISDYANRIQLWDIVSPGDTCVNNPPEEFVILLPSDSYELEFETTNGRSTLKWGNNICQYPQIFKLQDFADSLRKMISRKPEIMSLRETDLIRL